MVQAPKAWSAIWNQKNRIYEGENHQTIPAQEAIWSQIVIKEMSLFEAQRGQK